MSTEAALLATIADDPDDDTARLVYADFLDEKGGELDTPRAQFIRAQVELAKPAQKGDSKRRRELLSAAKKLHKQHSAAWCEPVFDALGTPKEKFWREVGYDEWDRGFRDWLHFDSPAAFREQVAAVRALTPITTVSFKKYTDADVLELLAAPELRTLKRLTLFGSAGSRGHNIGDDTLTALAACPHLARLEHLDLTQNRVTTAGVRAVAHSPTLTRLAKLNLYGNEVSDATFEMLVASPLGARMTHWEVNGRSEVTDGAARALAKAAHLTHITAISFSNTDISDAGVEALAKAEHLSGVTDLDFRNTNLTHRAAMAVARSPVFANLEQLSFAKTWIGGVGAKALRDSKYLRHIKFLALYSAVPDASEAALKKRFGRKVEFGRV